MYTKEKHYGIYPARVADHHDPERIGRVKVSLPGIYGVGPHNRSPWAHPANMMMAGGNIRFDEAGNVLEVQGDMGSSLIPAEGSLCYVMFICGDPRYPVYFTGSYGGSDIGDEGAEIVKSQMPEESKLMCPWGYYLIHPMGPLCLGCEDIVEHKEDAHDDLEHYQFHSHHQIVGYDDEGEPIYVAYCPRHRVVAKSEKGHEILMIDKDKRELFALIDRSGQCLKFRCAVMRSVQAEELPDGTFRRNLVPRGMRLMDRNTEVGEMEDPWTGEMVPVDGLPLDIMREHWAAIELRDLSRGHLRMETSSYVEIEGEVIESGEKAILWRSNRDNDRHQGFAIEHLDGGERAIWFGLNYDGEQMGPQVVIESGGGAGWFEILGPENGSYILLDDEVGGAYNGYFAGGRIVDTDRNDELNIGGDWRVWVGFGGALSMREPLNPLPLLDDKATLEGTEGGELAGNGIGSAWHIVLLGYWRVIGGAVVESVGLYRAVNVGGYDNLNVGGAKTVNIGGAYARNVGGVEAIDVGAARSVLVGGAHQRTIGGVDNHTIGGAQTVQVGGAWVIIAGGYAAIQSVGPISLKGNGQTIPLPVIVLDGEELWPSDSVFATS